MISCRVSVVLTLVVLACLVPGSLARKKGKRPAKRAENVTCPSGKHNYYVELEAGKNFTFELEDYYGDRSRCRVEYRVGSCSNVIVQSIGYNLKGKSCYTRTVGEGKSDESKAMKVRVCAEDVEKWPANDTDSSEDPSKIGMMQDSDSWDDVGINQDFVMAFNAPKGVANKGNSIMLNVHCEAGWEYKHDDQPNCQCGMEGMWNESEPVGWKALTEEDSEGDQYQGILIGKTWTLFALPDGTDELEEKFKVNNQSQELEAVPETSFKIGNNLWMINHDSVDNFGEAVVPICLPRQGSFDRKNRRVKSSGHQYDKETESFADNSTKLTLRVLKRKKCVELLEKRKRRPLEKDEGCVVPNRNSKLTVCKVDYGVPLLTKLEDESDNLALFGLITEFPDPDATLCATKGMPARFQRVDPSLLEKISELDSFVSCPAHEVMPNCYPPESSEVLPFYCVAGEDCCGETCCEKDENCLSSGCCKKSDSCEGICCGDGESCCGGVCCPEDDCCGETGKEFCCLTGESCCDDACCDKVCCDDTCCGAGETCCRDTCCAAGKVCCNGHCIDPCPDGSTCCGSGNCCATGAGKECCEGYCLDAACSSVGRECCGNVCCEANQECCSGKCITKCTDQQECCEGKCIEECSDSEECCGQACIEKCRGQNYCCVNDASGQGFCGDSC